MVRPLIYPEGRMAQINITALPRQITAWKAAAERSGLSFPAWVRLGLDQRVKDAERKKARKRS